MGQRKIGCMLILLLILLFPLNVSATQSRTGNFNKSFTLSGNQANDICSVALAQYQRTGAMFGYTEGWCADFVSDCAILAGASSAIPASGGVSYLKQNILNAGGQVVSTPQVGDIAFMDWGGGGNYYHVEIVYAVSGSTVSTIGGNSGRNTSSNSTSEVWKHGPYAVNHKYFTCFVRPNYKNNDPLTISNVKISDVTSNSYTISCNITGNVTRALFPTWPSADDSGNPIWHEGTISGNTASCVIKRSDHGNKMGTYISHIYIYDAAGNNVSAAAPEVQLVAFDSCLDYPTANASYTDTVYVAGWVVIPNGITNVTGWCNGISFDLPLFDRSDVPNGKGFNAFIPELYMKNGTNNLDIYGYHGTTPYHIKNINFTYKDIKRPSISDVKIINITEDSYTVTCKVSDNVKVTSAYFPTWPSIGNSSDPIWHQGTINGDTASCVIKKSEHENKTGTYISHIYVYDAAGNEASYAAPAVEIGKKHQHDYTSSIKKPATCTESGILLYTCKDNDDSYEETIPATGHQHTELRNVKAATCTQEGYTGDTYCKDCNTRLSSGKAIAQKLHTWDAGKVTREATCTETGIKTYTCTGCQTTKTEEIAATGHRNTEYRNAKEATCAEAGYTGDLYCKDCNTKLRNGSAIAKKSHTWDAGVITTMATCTAKGTRTYTCTSCKATKTEELPVTGHQHTEVRNVKAATCAQEGYTGDTYCKDCGAKLSSGQKTNKTEHQWNSGKVTKNATCTEAGIKTYTCIVCESTRIEELPATGHQTKVTKFAKEASCKTEGYTGDIYCQDCGKLLQEGAAIPKNAHTWNAGVITKAATCTEAGVRTFTCTVCGTTRTETISATGHGALEIRSRREASCAADGYTGDTYCTVCGRKIATGSSIAKTGHSWNGGVVTKQPTTTENGVRTFTCQKCGTTRTEAIAKLEVPRATPGSVVKDKATNGVYRVLQDGLSVQFVKPITKKKATVKIPERVQVNGISCAVTEIAANAFKGNTSLKSVSIGKNVTNIGANAFYGCKKLSKVSGGNGIAKISDKAFYNCASLTSIIIPGTVRSIGKQAFCNCKKLKNITIRTSTLTSRDIGAKAFSGTYKKPTVKVPAKSLKEYKKLFKAKGMNAKAVYKK